MGGRRTFLRSFLAHPREVGALLPTSRRAVSDTLDLARVEQARVLVEFGAGNGVYTRELLRRMAPDARLLAFELDPQLAAAIRASVRDPRLELVAGSAEEAERRLAGSRADVLVSALPFTSLPTPMRQRLLDVSSAILAPWGEMVLIQYSPLLQRQLERRFGSVQRRLSPLNVPPAFLFRCAEPVAGA